MSTDAKPVEPAPGLLRSSAVVSLMTMLSRVLGLARDVAIAGLIGAGGNADAFFVAFKIPNFMRRLFAEGAFAQAFVPVLSEYRSQGSHAAVKALIDRVSGVLGAVLAAMTAFVLLAAPVVTILFAPGFWMNDPDKFALTSDMLRITFPYLFLIALTGLAGGILNSYNRFAVPAFTPVLLNVCLIGAALFGADYFDEPALALAWGVLLAGMVQLTFQLPFLSRLGLLPRPRWDWQDQGVQRILKLMVPALFGVSVSQINLMFDTMLASFLPTGSVSWLYYSDRLVELPLGIFAIAIATVILPKLSRLNAQSDAIAVAATLDWALRGVLLLGVPAAAALVVLREPILITLFQYGELGARDIAMSSLSLAAYSAGLLAFMLVKVLAPGYFARQDMKTPVRFGIIAMVANMLLNVLFVVPLHSVWQIGHVGLAAATAASAWINAGLLARGLLREGIYLPQVGWLAYAGRLLLATAAMVALLVLVSPDTAVWLDWGWQQRAPALALTCAAGAAAYGLALLLSGMRPRHFRAAGSEL